MQIGVETSKAVDNKRVFVVDSDEITRAALQFMLHDENETHELDSLEAAFRKGADWKPDLLLLGMDIVHERGIEALATIKAQLPGAKIVLVAEAAEDPLEAQCLAAGADGTLRKPLTIEATRRAVDRMLARKTRTVIPLHAV